MDEPVWKYAQEEAAKKKSGPVVDFAVVAG